MKVAAESGCVEGRTVVQLGDEESFKVPRGGHVEIVAAKASSVYNGIVKFYDHTGAELDASAAFRESR